MMGEPKLEILQALRAFRKELGSIPKTAANPFFKSSYAALDEIQRVIEPVLDAHGLTLHCSFKELDSGTALMMDLYHDAGSQMPTSEFRIRCKQTKTTVKDDKKGTVTTTEVIDNPQDAGSGVTYAIRYCITAYLGLILGGDDDGNRASGNSERRQSSPGSQQSERGGNSGGGSAEDGMSGGGDDSVGDVKNRLIALESAKKAEGMSQDDVNKIKEGVLGNLILNHPIEKLKEYGDALVEAGGQSEPGDLPEM